MSHLNAPNDIIFSMSQQIKSLKNTIQQNKKQIHPTCSLNHPLRYLITKQRNQTQNAICYHCHKSIKDISNVCWFCHLCQKAYCKDCKGYERNLCPFGHVVEYIKQYETWKFCDICIDKGIKSGQHCNCDFDICENCHNK